MFHVDLDCPTIAALLVMESKIEVILGGMRMEGHSANECPYNCTIHAQKKQKNRRCKGYFIRKKYLYVAFAQLFKCANWRIAMCENDDDGLLVDILRTAAHKCLVKNFFYIVRTI